jgi:4-azaleucine resistance transporter AzlC
MPDNLNIKEGFYCGLPVLAGYFPIAVTFGLLARTVNISLSDTFCFSAFVFAGASQFVGLNMFHAGMGAGQIALTVFLLNFRHFLMSATLSSKTQFSRIFIPLISFGITDETFALASTRKERLTDGFILALNFTSYTGWITGTIAGYIAGNFLPDKIQASISICLYVLFVAILVPEIKRTFAAGTVAAAAAAVNSGLVYLNIFSSGWNIIISILAASLTGFLLFNKGDN